MTKTDYTSMTDADLTRAVSERVGWRFQRLPDADVPQSGLRPAGRAWEIARPGQSLVGENGNVAYLWYASDHLPLPSFATDIGAAMGLADGWDVSIDGLGANDIGDGQPYWWVKVHHSGRRGAVKGRSLPRAICLAYLAATDRNNSPEEGDTVILPQGESIASINDMDAVLERAQRGVGAKSDLTADIAKYRAMRDAERAQEPPVHKPAQDRPGDRKGLLRYLRDRRGA